MSNPRFNGWSYYGTGRMPSAPTPAAPSARTTARTALIEVRVPKDCRVLDVECQFDTIAGGAATATAFIFRDAAGDILFLAGAAVTITTGTATATDGGSVHPVDRDHHETPDSVVAARPTATTTAGNDLPANEYASLYVGVALNAGTANLNRLAVNWRA
ncbi:MAG: hypothetical protein QME96_08245 [Myxococcota bacterium]|nr:hypothetical protein [Myxococcota bacterium]